ncbi:MAG: lipoate--protein ligase family protein [Alistipes sp.]|nr:lipoate--protein ligase family protein [Alistipes sp.]
MRILVSEYRDAERNLDLEQELLAGSEEVVLLYINDPAVIVGRNQTIEAEIDGDYCMQHGIKVVRRKSGGGAVYHDGGNLNYAIICNGGERPLDRDYTEAVVWALRHLGIDATTGKRGEIRVGESKISGSASMVSGGRVLFHGTLLFNADLTRLEAALQGDDSRRGKGVKSVRSKVTNLAPMLPDIANIDGFTERLRLALTEFYNRHKEELQQ